MALSFGFGWLSWRWWNFERIVTPLGGKPVPSDYLWLVPSALSFVLSTVLAGMYFLQKRTGGIDI